MQVMDAAAARGRVAVQRCTDCGRAQYPPREICSACLGETLDWEEAASVEVELLAETTLHHSHDPGFADTLPRRIGLARLLAGPVVVAFLDGDCVPGALAHLTARLDAAGRAVLHAGPVP